MSQDSHTRVWSLKLIIIGQPSVGKTSLRRAYLGEKFRVNYIATIGADFSFKQIDLDDDQINTSIWDLAGQEETFANIHPQYYRGSAGALVVFDTTNKTSFDSVPEWISKYQSLTGEQKCPILIVGNKVDLIAQGHAGISEEEQEELVQGLRDKYQNRFPILSSRTSAKTGKEINESFRTLVSKIVDWQKKRISPSAAEEKRGDDYIATAYMLTFHDMYGPRILVRSGEDQVDSDKEFASAIKISSILDFDDVIKFAQVTGSTPWNAPEGMFYYIAFTVDNPKARGGKSLFIAGFVGRRDIREFLSQSQHIIDGILHSTMNEIVRILVTHNLDLTSEESAPPPQQLSDEMSTVLNELQAKVFDIIKPKL
ncbi:MAG: Rab family GTPase [Candidatus Kariarchaeaceae archaeon]